MAESKRFGWEYEFFNQWSIKWKIESSLRIIFTFTVIEITRITVNESNKNDIKDDKRDGVRYSFS